MKETKMGRRPGCCERFYPTGFWSGLKGVVKAAAPLILQQLTIYMLAPVALMFSGHLGKLELDAVALAGSFVNIFGISLAVGMTSACDTLFAQVYGTGDTLKMGIILQRSCVILFFLMLISLSLLVNAEAICLFLGQQEDVAELAGDYILLMIPGIFCFYIFICLMKFIQNQNHILPTLLIGVLANVANALLHYLLIYVANMDIYGSAIAQSISYFLMLALSIVYVIFSGLHRTSWNGFSVESLAAWGQFSYLGISGLFMICIEWWCFEAGIILAGVLGTTELAAQSLVFQIEVVTYMFPLGNGIATSIKVGQFLGASEPEAAKTIARVGITFIVMTGLTMGVLLTVLKDYLPLIFTSEPDVISLSSSVLPVMGAYMLFDSVAGTCGGILRGSGRQTLGAFIVLFGYVIALSIGVPLMLLSKLGILGFWIGLMTALMIVAALETTIIVRMDWENEARKANARVDATTKNTTENDPLMPSTYRSYSRSSSIAMTANQNLKTQDINLDIKQNRKTDIFRSVLITFVFVGIFLTSIFIRIFVIEQGGPLIFPEKQDEIFNTTATAM